MTAEDTLREAERQNQLLRGDLTRLREQLASVGGAQVRAVEALRVAERGKEIADRACADMRTERDLALAERDSARQEIEQLRARLPKPDNQNGATDG